MKRNIVRYAVIVSAILLLFVSFLLFKKQTVSPVSLTIADADQIVFSLVYIADAEGYFRDEGLDVSYRKFKSGKDALADVVAGNADVATVYQTPVVADIVGGKPIRVLTTLHRSSKNTALVARKDRGINSLADLRGKRIAATRGTYQAKLLTMMLEDEGIGPGNASVVDMYHQDMLAALADGAVDAAITRWPYIGYAQEQSPPGSTVVLSSPFYSEASLLAASQQAVEKKQVALFRLMRALVSAQDFVARDNDKAFSVAISHWSRLATGDDRKIWDQIQLQLRLDNTLLQSMQSEAAWLKGHGGSNSVPDSFLRYMDSSFLSAIRPQYVLVRHGS
jgi:NitT/TauT family transport system substrate-binding protein